jgi:hypothetical protein
MMWCDVGCGVMSCSRDTTPTGVRASGCYLRVMYIVYCV